MVWESKLPFMLHEGPTISGIVMVAAWVSDWSFLCGTSHTSMHTDFLGVFTSVVGTHSASVAGC